MSLKREMLRVFVGAMLLFGGLATTSFVVPQFELAAVPWGSLMISAYLIYWKADRKTSE